MEADIFCNKPESDPWRHKVEIEILKTECRIKLDQCRVKAEKAEDNLDKVLSFFFSEDPRVKQILVDKGLTELRKKFFEGWT